jgi:hypothetical protein
MVTANGVWRLDVGVAFCAVRFGDREVGGSYKPKAPQLRGAWDFTIRNLTVVRIKFYGHFTAFGGPEYRSGAVFVVRSWSNTVPDAVSEHLSNYSIDDLHQMATAEFERDEVAIEALNDKYRELRSIYVATFLRLRQILTVRK